MMESGAPGSDSPTPAARRYLTIVFADLSDFTSLSERLDPEELHDVRNKYQRLALEIVERYGGFVSSFAGDGILIYFGYPIAHENDAERATRAALELIQSVPTLHLDKAGASHLELSVRVGVHTGAVLIAPELASSGIFEHAVVGWTVNLASRLQHMAEPNTVLVSQDTLELVEGIFEVESQGLRSVRGSSHPIAVHRIAGLRQAGHRSDARFRRGSMQMIGRQATLEKIAHEWAKVVAESRSRILFVVGEAGIGKTRLVMECQRRAGLQAQSVRQFNCHELFSATPLYPVAATIWARAGLRADDAEATRAAKIRTLLEGFGLASDENVATTNSLLESFGAPKSGSELPPDIKKRQFDLLTSLLHESVRRGPVFVWVEDAHWLDPSSAELLGVLAERVRNEPVLLLATMRPGFHLSSLPPADVVVPLQPLSNPECLELAYSVPGARTLSTDLLNQAVNLAEGSPLFVEQLTLSLIDSRGQVQLKGAQNGELPLTLAEMMSERLDRLPGARDLVQTAACIGRFFSRQFLEELVENAGGNVGDILALLVKAEILRLPDDSLEARYEFRHALLQRAAYDLMVPSARRATHARIAKAIASGNSGPIIPEVLAYHFTAAEQFEDAIGGWREAAAAAARRSAYIEAIAHLEHGLSLIEKIGNPGARRALELGLQAALIGPYTAVAGPTSEKLLKCCQRGLELCSDGPATPLILAFLFGQFSHAVCRGDTPSALMSAELFLSVAKDSKYESGQVIGYRLIGMVRLGKGEVSRAIEALQTSLKLFMPERDAAATHMFGQDAQVHSRSLLSFALIQAGRVDEALEVGKQALLSLDELRHPHSSALALGYVGGWVFGLCGFTKHLMEASRRLVSLSDQHGLKSFRIFGQAFIGWALCQAGDLSQGIANLQEAVCDLESTGFRLTLPGHMAVLADAMRRAGRHTEARDVCGRALEIVLDTGERLHEPEVRRILALSKADAQGGADSAVADMLQSAVVCGRQSGQALYEFRSLRAMKDYLGSQALNETGRRRMEELSYLGSLGAGEDRCFGFAYPAAAT